jgi:hypothetical protein
MPRARSTSSSGLGTDKRRIAAVVIRANQSQRCISNGGWARLKIGAIEKWLA